MKKIVTITAVAGVLALSGCKSGAEMKGDAAWKIAQTSTQESEKLMKQKEAYIYYQQAVQKKGDKSKPELLSHFIEAAVARISFTYEAEGGDNDQIKLVREEIDPLVVKEGVAATAKDAYATFIMKLADEQRTAGKLTDCMALVEQALRVAADKKAIQATKDEITKDFVAEQVSTAKTRLEEGAKMKDEKAITQAEYAVSVALYYDSTNSEAQAILSKTRQALIGTYTNFPGSIEVKTDTTLFKKIAAVDILMAVTSVSGGGSSMEINIYNYANGALRINEKTFYLLDDAGNKYPAKSCKADKDFLEQEFETKVALTFPKPSGKLKAIVYESEEKDRNAPKYFY